MKGSLYFSSGFQDAAKLLIHKGADVNVAGRDFKTALMWSVYNGIASNYKLRHFLNKS